MEQKKGNLPKSSREAKQEKDERLKSIHEANCQKVIDDYRERKRKDQPGSLHGLCIRHNVPYPFFRSWLRAQNLTSSDIICEALDEKENRYRPEDESFTPDDYEALLSSYKKWLVHDPHQPLKRFCEKHQADYKALQQWMRRRNITISELKVRAGVALEQKMTGKTQPSIFGRVLHSYKKKLEEDPKYSLRQHCCDCHADYGAMQQWLARVGIQIKNLKAAVRIEQKAPHQHSVFVQFKPNGGSNGDRLTGVRIQMADGSTIQVEECTVISLCAFINQYNNDQKRHSHV